MRNFREYTIWQDAIALTTEIYRCCNAFPKHELYSLTSQMERAAVSIASNIAEGAGRDSESDFAHFLDMALGSAYEVETQIEIAHNLNYLNDTDYRNLINNLQSLQRRTTAFIITLRGK